MCIRDSSQGATLDELNSNLQEVIAMLLEDGEPDLESEFVCLLYTSDAADERSSVDLGGRRIIKKKHIMLNVV